MMNEQKTKVGIVTLHGYENYGNKLQNYALQEVIKDLGFTVETVVITNTQNNEKKYLQKINKATTMSFKEIYKKIYARINRKKTYYINRKLINERINCFKDFSDIYLTEKFYSNEKLELGKVDEEYDYFITGSDQVWNPLYINKLPIYFLTFANKNKRISYAPSFGRSNIPKEYEERFRKWILGINRLSVREEAGSKIIKDLTGKDAIVLVDPTLMLTKEQWLSISKGAPNKPSKGYILTYFLGGISKENKNYINTVAKQNELDIINMADLKDRDTYKTGPSEFIDYINSANVFLTDSFHGVVFSILMETPFIVYKRISKSASMYSRIETLLDMFDLKSREAQNIKNMEEIFNVDYSHVPPILEEERKKSLDYLKEALNIKG